MQRSRWILVVIVLGWLLAGSVLYFYHKRVRLPEEARRAAPVRIAYLPISAGLSFFVAQEQEMFSPLHIEATRYPDANQAMNAMVAGKADVAIMIGYSTLFVLHARSADLFRIVQSGVETEKTYTSRILVLRESSIQSIADLRRKKIGTYAGSTQRLNLLLILAKYFNDPERDVEIVQVDTSLQLPSLAARRFDALFTIDPHATIGLQTSLARSIDESPRAKYIVNPFPTCATVFSKSFLDNRPEEARRVLGALENATKWATENAIDAAILSANPKYTDVPSDVAPKCGTYTWWRRGQEDLVAVQTLADLMHKHQVLSVPIRVSEMFADPRQLY